MSKQAKVSFLVAFLIAVVIAVASVLTGTWWNLFTVALYFAGLCVLAGFAFDYKLYLEFFTMRTTKNGMSMGLTIVIALVLAVCVNYLGNLHSISWDVTQEKLNSLSDETRNVITGLKGDLEIKVFTREMASPEQKQTLKAALTLYTDFTSRVKVRYINPYIENDLAMEYLNKLPDHDNQSIFAFVEYAGKRIRVAAPFDEASITSAIIKSTRNVETKIYFTRGHGEKDIESDGESGIKDLAQSLSESSFKVLSVNIVDDKKVPDDAAVLAIIGPKVPFLDSEIKWLHDYAARGGRIIVALDPGTRSNLAGFVKSLGVEFENNYVFTLAPLTGGGPALIAARSFDAASEITRNFASSGTLAMFYISSAVKVAPDKPAEIQVAEIVKSAKDSFTVTDLSQKLMRKPETLNVSMAAEAHGKIDPKAEKDFAAVIFGDSDFMANQTLMIGVNRDLIMNSFAMLTEQKDLLSIRPKMPKGTLLILTNINKLFVIILGLALPMILLITSGVLWFRRRGA